MVEAVHDIERDKNIPENDKKIESENNLVVIKKWQIWKNLFVLCIAWVLLFTAFDGISNLQSSLNFEGDVGMNSMAILHSFLIFSSIILPHPMISIFGMKWTIVICQFGYLAFIAANLYPKPALMYSASVLIGLAGAPLWTSKCAYLTEIGILNAESKGKKADAGVSYFFGIFFAFYQTSEIWGNLISYMVLRRTDKPIALNETSFNVSYERRIDQTLIIKNATHIEYQCGAGFFEKEFQETTANPVPKNLVLTLCYIYIAVAIASIILVAVLLDQRRSKDESKKTIKASLKNAAHHMASTFKHLKYPNQILIIPFTIWLGLEQAYITALFTKGFITCAAGIKYVGLIMIVYGICDALSSFTFGHIAKYLNRIYYLIMASLINYALIITMLIWIPRENQLWVLFIIAGLWGIADGCWQIQLNAAYGVLFPEHEPAFSNFHLWESLGFVIAYIYTPRIRIRYAHIILLCVLTVSMLCYFIIHIRERKRKKELKKERPETSREQIVEPEVISAF